MRKIGGDRAPIGVENKYDSLLIRSGHDVRNPSEKCQNDREYHIEDREKFCPEGRERVNQKVNLIVME